MKKHNCHINTSEKKILGAYFHYTIHASEKDGFIKEQGSIFDKHTKITSRLGEFFEYDGGRHNQPSWWWKLLPFTEGGRERPNNKHFSSKDEAIASLKNALNKRGYKLITGEE